MGALDEEFRELAVEMLDEFSDEEHLLERHAANYAPESGLSFPSTTSAQVKKSPNFPFEHRQIDGKNVLETDFQTIIAAKPLEAAGLSLTPEDGVRLTLTVDGKAYSIRGARPLESGDQVAAYILHLRSS